MLNPDDYLLDVFDASDAWSFVCITKFHILLFYLMRLRFATNRF